MHVCLDIQTCVFMPPPTDGCVGGIICYRVELSIRESVRRGVHPVSRISYKPKDRTSPTLVVFKPPPPVGAGGGYMFSGRPSVPLSVRPSVIHVVVLRFHDISSICWRIFAKLLSLVHLGTEMNWLHFGVKRSKFKVTAWPNASQIFVFPLYLQYLLIDFRQSFVTGASWDTDDLITFLGQKVKVQGHTIAAEAHSTRCYRGVQLFLVCDVVEDTDELIRFGFKVKVTVRSNIWASYCGGWRHPHWRLGISVSSWLFISFPCSTVLLLFQFLCLFSVF